ncbi:MAG: TRAP transporter substrate-binding protein [Oscillospiraceae bacterium]|nr:TRAP transporter substrate-binding protein [Oscillospiraceae bacterium]
MRIQKLLALILALAMVLALAACGGSKSDTTTTAPAQSESTTEAAPAATDAASVDGAPAITSTDKIDMIWSHNAAETTAGHRAAVEFKNAMEKYSNGNITVTLYANGELGTVPENDQALREGTIQIGSGTTGGLVDPSLSYFDCPNLVDSNEQALAMMSRDGELYQYTEQKYEDIGLKMLSIVPGGFRETSSNKEVRSYEDLKGLKIRTLENPIAIAYWQSWGCTPTPISFSDLYLALQQGLVEAQENAYDTIVASALYEQQKYIINTHHVIMWSGMYMNLDFYNSLPDDYKALIDWVIAEIYEPFLYEESIKANEAALQTMKDAGLEVIDFTTEDYAKMREAAKPAYDLIRQTVGDEAMDIIAKAQAAAANG